MVRVLFTPIGLKASLRQGLCLPYRQTTHGAEPHLPHLTSISPTVGRGEWLRREHEHHPYVPGVQCV